MKIAGVFLLVALGSCFDSSDALIGVLGKGAKGAKGGQHGNCIPMECLIKLIKKNLPGTVKDLQNMVCKFIQGKKENNAILYKEFLDELHALLRKTGCSVDQLVGIETPAVEQLTDKVGETAHEALSQLLPALEDTPLLDLVMKVGCSLDPVLQTVHDLLGGLGLLDGLLNGLNLGPVQGLVPL